MKKYTLAMIALALCVVTVGCDKKDKEATADHDHETATADHDHERAKDEDKEEEKLEKVEVPKQGEKFEPAIQAEQLSADAWFCDMGTVHWAGMTKPDDGKCPVCGADLKQYNPEARAAKKKEAAESHDHHEGDHDHDHAH